MACVRYFPNYYGEAKGGRHPGAPWACPHAAQPAAARGRPPIERIETEEGFDLADLLHELAMLELKALGDIKHGVERF